MTQPTKTVRCTACRAEFTEAELEGATCCPTCGATGVPMAIADDVEITLNKHELRILTIWASNWAADCDRRDGTQQAQRAIGGILHRLRQQLPGVPLTMSDEAQALADELGTEVKARSSEGTAHYKPRGKN